MYNSINNISNYNLDDCYGSRVDIDQPICSLTADNSSYSSNQSPQDLSQCYDGFSNIDAVSKFCEGDFLREYVISCECQLTEDFLSTMNKHKINFIDKIDSILIGLYSSFYGDFEDNINTTDLMNRYCSSFSKCAYDLRSKCICILRYDIIPVAIKSIFNSKVIGVNSERDMTYPEMERLFLHFVATLDKLIMVKIMNYWLDFCRSKKKYIASLVSDIDYSNPFICAYYFDKTSAPNITCPVAFASKFGEYISFITIAKIDDMVGEFIGKCNDVLKGIISSKCSCIYNYTDRICGNPKELRNEFNVLIKEEFSQSVIREGIKDKFINFLKNAVIWNVNRDLEVTRSLISDKIIGCMRNLLVNTATRDACRIIKSFHERHKIIRNFHEKLGPSKKRLSSFGKCFPTIEDRWGVKFRPEDDCKISSIKREFVARSRDVIKDKFSSILKEGHLLLNGSVGWYKVSKKLFPIAQEAVRSLVDAEHEELCKFLCSARIIEDIDIFNGYSVGTRKATPEERDSILKIYTNHIHRRNRDLSSIVWNELINGKKNNFSKHIDYYSKLGESEKREVSAIDPIHRVGDSDYSVTTSSIQSERPIVTSTSVKLLGKNDKVINMWGLNLHPDDVKLISFIRKKFLTQIADNITKLFYGMLKSRTILPSGRVLCNSSWVFVSGELSEIATESVDSIIKNQYEELDRIMSKARIIVGVDGSDSSSCIIRVITDGEKTELMIRARKIIDRNIYLSIRSSWLRIVCNSSTDIGYGYKEKSRGICGSVREGSWGVKLRYSDNIAILNTRKKFSSMIRGILYNKFSSMIDNKHRFEDGTFIGVCAWFIVSKKLIPIVQKEVKYILEDESRELEKIISRARVVVDLEKYRELTSEESSMIFKNVMNLLYNSLKKLCKSTWDEVISSLVVNCVVLPSSANVPYTTDNGGSIGVRLRYEDDVAISSIRKKFSSEIGKCVSDKCSEIIKKSYELGDSASIGMYSWGMMSRKILPIIKKEINPIIENERIEISDRLMKSLVDVSSPDSPSIIRVTRNITPEERDEILEDIMESVDKRIIPNCSRIWNRVVKLPCIYLRDLSEEYKSKLDNIRLEFIGNLGSIVDEVVSSLSSDIDISSLSSLGDIRSDVYSIVSQKSRNLFNEEGFLDKVELLLSDAMVVGTSGNDRLITDEEKKCVLKEFIDMIYSDRECLIKKRTNELKDLKIESKFKNKRKRNVISDDGDLSIEDEHSYAKMAFVRI